MYSEKLAFIITVNFRFGDHDTLPLQTPNTDGQHITDPRQNISRPWLKKTPAIKDSWFKGLTE